VYFSAEKIIIAGLLQLGSLNQMALAINLQHRYTYEYCRHCGFLV